MRSSTRSFPGWGAYASALAEDSAWVADVSEAVDVPDRLVLFRLPLLAVYLLSSTWGISRLAERRPQVASPEPAT